MLQELGPLGEQTRDAVRRLVLGSVPLRMGQKELPKEDGEKCGVREDVTGWACAGEEQGYMEGTGAYVTSR